MCKRDFGVLCVVCVIRWSSLVSLGMYMYFEEFAKGIHNMISLPYKNVPEGIQPLYCNDDIMFN